MRTIRRFATPVAVFVVVAGAGCARWEDDAGFAFEGTAFCRARHAELAYDPDGRIEVRVNDETVAWGDRGTRGLDLGPCAKARRQPGWSVGFPYDESLKALTVTCRFSDGFFVHVHPVWVTDPDPDGSAVNLVAGERGTLAEEKALVASGTVVAEDESRTRLIFSPEYCARR